MDWRIKRYPLYFGNIRQPYSKSVVIGNLIFLSGMAGVNLDSGEIQSDSFKEQAWQVFDNIKSAIEEAGSSMNSIIKTEICLRNIQQDRLNLRDVELSYYRKHAPLLLDEPPVCTIMQPCSLLKTDYQVEISAIAYISNKIPHWEVKRYPMYRQKLRTIDNANASINIPSIKAVSVGNLIFLPCLPAPAGDLESTLTDNIDDQILVSLDEVKYSMELAGSSMSNIIKIDNIMKNIEDIPRMWMKEQEYYRKHSPLLVEEPPVSSFNIPSTLADLRHLIEIDALGVISRYRPGWEVRKYPMYYGVKQPYSRYVIVGNLIFVSGMPGETQSHGKVTTLDLREQMIIALDKIRSAMEQAGSSMNNIIKTKIFLKNLEDYPRMREIEYKYYQQHAPLLLEKPPVCTFMVPKSMWNSEYQVEIEVTGTVAN